MFIRKYIFMSYESNLKQSSKSQPLPLTQIVVGVASAFENAAGRWWQVTQPGAKNNGAMVEDVGRGQWHPKQPKPDVECQQI